MRIYLRSSSQWAAVAAGLVLAIASDRAQAQAVPQIQKAPGESSKHQPHVQVQPTDVQWQPGPPALPSGAQMAVLSGNPKQPGPFTMRLKTPAGYKIPPHTHTADENVTVISGKFQISMGDSFDESKGKPLGPGSFFSMPAGMHHFAYSPEESVIQLHGVGPWDIQYLNPSDDPRRKLTPTGRTEE